MTDTLNASALLPCPFCGGAVDYVAQTTVAWVRCDSCHAEGPSAPTQDQAKDAWNGRASGALAARISAPAPTAELPPGIMERGTFREDGWPVGWAVRGPCPEGVRALLTFHPDGRVDVLDVPNKEMTGERCAAMVPWLQQQLEEARAETLAARVELKALLSAPAAPAGWISIDTPPLKGRQPILVAVAWTKYGEHEDGSPAEFTGVDVTEGEYVPAFGDREGCFESYQGTHGDRSGVTHWMSLPEAPNA